MAHRLALLVAGCSILVAFAVGLVVGGTVAIVALGVTIAGGVVVLVALRPHPVTAAVAAAPVVIAPLPSPPPLAASVGTATIAACACPRCGGLVHWVSAFRTFWCARCGKVNADRAAP